MFCARCGQQIPDTTERCPLCGRDANINLVVPPAAVGEAAAPAVALAPADTILLRPIRKDLQGVGGWLLLFCVGLVVLSPVVTLAQVGNLAQISDGSNADVLGTALEFARVAFGIVVGMFLWNVRPIAFTLLWVYFGIVAFFSVLGIIGLAISARETATEDFILLFRTLIYVLVWFLYFRKSERVRATFGRNL